MGEDESERRGQLRLLRLPQCGSVHGGHPRRRKKRWRSIRKKTPPITRQNRGFQTGRFTWVPERCVGTVLTKQGRWQEADFKTRSKGDSVTVALAARWRAETTMTAGWIAERLAMGTGGYLNPLLSRRRKLRWE